MYTKILQLGPQPEWYMAFIAISIGLFIVGFLVFLIEVFFSGLHLFDSDGDVTDLGKEGAFEFGKEGALEIGKEGTFDLGKEGTFDLGKEGTFDLGKEGAIEVGKEGFSEISKEIQADDGSTPTPFFLLIAAYCFSTGFIGMFLTPEQFGSYSTHTITAFFLPLGVVWLVSKLWGKVASDFIHPLPTYLEGTVARTLTEVDSNGGLILVGSDTPLEQLKKPAKSNGEIIPRNSLVFIIDKSENFFIVTINRQQKAKEWIEE